jgi:hypothetical protein
LNDECEIIFSPSGTDSSLQIAAITQIISDKDITHVLVASDETGSGVASLKVIILKTSKLSVKKG